jgi:hypothetical protein
MTPFTNSPRFARAKRPWTADEHAMLATGWADPAKQARDVARDCKRTLRAVAVEASKRRLGVKAGWEGGR